MDKVNFDVTGKRVWIAGGRGLVGSACVSVFQTLDCALITDPHRDDLDLRDALAVDAFIQDQKPDVIILAAAKVGGIGDNALNNDAFYRDNSHIQNAVINAAAKYHVAKLVFLGSSCIYPRDCPQPIREEYLETGALEETNVGYARAKIDGIRLVQRLRGAGHDFISLMPCNLYGSNDHFMDGLRPHVIPALMHKIKQAMVNDVPSISVWGTGTPLREFMHVDDLAAAIVFAVRHYSGAIPLNVGGGDEISIAQLAQDLCDIAGYDGVLEFDPSMPDGTPRKVLDSSKMRGLGWTPQISLPMGLSKVWNDFSMSNQAQRKHYQHG